jgi:hypothetical protein
MPPGPSQRPRGCQTLCKLMVGFPVEKIKFKRTRSKSPKQVFKIVVDEQGVHAWWVAPAHHNDPGLLPLRGRFHASKSIAPVDLEKESIVAFMLQIYLVVAERTNGNDK